MMWLVSVAAGIVVWLLWLWRPKPESAGERPWTDPHAAEIAEFRRAVNDYSRG